MIDFYEVTYSKLDNSLSPEENPEELEKMLKIQKEEASGKKKFVGSCSSFNLKNAVP